MSPPFKGAGASGPRLSHREENFFSGGFEIQSPGGDTTISQRTLEYFGVLKFCVVKLKEKVVEVNEGVEITRAAEPHHNQRNTYEAEAEAEVEVEVE